MAAVGTTLLFGQENSIMGGDRIRAVGVSHRALEAARSVRDGSFAALAAGTYGVDLATNGVWQFIATPQTITGGYLTTVTVAASGSTWRTVNARTVWKHGYARSGSIVLSSDMTDWRGTMTRGDWRTLTVDGTYAPGGSPLFTKAAIGGSVLYVAAADSTGLYALDITNTTSPSRIASGFSVGHVVYDVLVHGKRLYLMTADSSAELKVYDITIPTSLAAGSLITSVNLAGSGRGRSLAITDDVLLAGLTYSATSGESELYAYRVSTGSTLTQIDAEEDTGDLLALAATGTGVYAATTIDATELRAFRIYNSGSLAVASVAGDNVAGAPDAYSIAITGTSAILGTQKGGTQEMVVYNLRPKVPALASPGPWYHEGSGSLVGVAMDPARCVGFLAADSGRKSLQVVYLNTSTLTEFATHTSTTGKGRGVLYDPVRDRVVLLTEQAVVIFRPAASTGSCP